tara:strand:+ start:2242 stop:2451 length:210 start_codon:yes stop_codon:yes gene_type:complete
MGDTISRYHDIQEEKEFKQRVQTDLAWLATKGATLRRVKPQSDELESMKWLDQNMDKILKNRKIIELLG